jgi:protein kinase A
MNLLLLLELVIPYHIYKLGSFGRVRLTRNKKTGEYFAMKILKKADIIKLKQVDHVISENTILADIDHPFLVSNLPYNH